MDRDRELREAIVEVGRRLYAKGLVAAADGNVSIRTESGEIYVTPSGMCKGYLAPADVVVTDARGQRLRGERKPSSELEMHLAVYDVRPDVFSVCHAHPPLATGFAAAGQALSPALLSEVVLTLGCVPLTEYATPTTRALADTIRRYAKGYEALLLANHGAVSVGRDAFDAYFKMETLEHYAKINLVTRILGTERRLPGEAVEKLMELKRAAGLPAGDPYCALVPGPAPAGPSATAGSPGDDRFSLTRDQLVDIIVRVLDTTAV